MKQVILLAISLLSRSFLFAQDNVTEDTTAKKIITEIGKPDGEKTEMTIGKEGGSFTSSDGTMRLLVPEGAVSKKTTFSIQPTTSHMPNGSGKAYQLEPSGINFQKPLQVIFYYPDREAEGGSPDLLRIAVQDDKGQWSSTKATIDSVAKTLTIETWHFSTFVPYHSAEINPSSARVKVNGSLRLRITNIMNIDYGTCFGCPLVVKTESAEIWKVNGIPKGNGTVGLISASQNYTAIFQAPAQVPSQNPVAVTVQENFYNYAPGKEYNVYTLVSNITIYEDGYEVKMVAALKGGSPNAWGGVVTYRDEGSFIVSLEKNKPAVINIKNQLEKVTDNCIKTILNPTTCTGLLHVAGARSIKVTPANPPGQPYPTVEIWFVQYPIELTRFSFLCPPPPGTKGSSKGTIGMIAPNGQVTPMLMFFGQPALPTYIKFIAKEEEQVLLEKSTPGGEIYYKFWVRKVKEN